MPTPTIVNPGPPSVVIPAPKKYDVILCDPPWTYSGSQTKMGAAGNHYKLMSQQDLGALNIKSILKKKGMVLMWATGPRFDFAIDLIRAWGLHFRGVGFVWVKTRKDGVIINGQGVPPTFTKPTTEYVLVATTQRAGRPVKLIKHNTPQVVLAPRAGHSTKPEKVRQLIEATLGTSGVDYLEMFARIQVPGWDAIGNHLCQEDISTSIGKLNGTMPCGPISCLAPAVPLSQPSEAVVQESKDEQKSTALRTEDILLRVVPTLYNSQGNDTTSFVGCETPTE